MKRLAIIPTAFALVAMVAACTEGTAPDVSQPLFRHGGDHMPVTEFTLFLAAETETILNPQECIRVDKKGTLHLRNCEFVASITGDFEGVEHATLDLVQHADGNGHARGSFTLDMCHMAGDLGCGIFEGHFAGPIVAGVGFRGHVKARGTDGDFVGLRMDATSTNTPEAPRPFVVTGTIR